MVKHTQTIRRQQPTNCLGVFDHFVGLALKELMKAKKEKKFVFIVDYSDTPNSFKLSLSYSFHNNLRSFLSLSFINLVQVFLLKNAMQAVSSNSIIRLQLVFFLLKVSWYPTYYDLSAVTCFPTND